MDDLISRQAAIEALGEQPDSGDWMDEWECGCRSQWGRDKEAIENVPAAQPEIIRCKECKHSEHWYKDKRRCFLWHESGIDVFDDGFCNYAKRKENG